jgi:cytoskeletal protein RodZ
MSEPAPGDQPAAGGGVGPALRAARERRGLSVATVTETLHLEPRILEAMEADRFTVFDAPVYARGFIRKVASFLELPVEPLIAAYDAQHAGPESPTMIPITETAAPMRDFGKLKVPAVFVLLLLIVAGSYWWWLGRAPAPQFVPASAQLARAEPAAASPVATALPAAASEPPPAAAPIETAARPAVEARPLPRASLVRAAATGRPGVLTVSGLAESWVEVYGAQGERLLYDLVEPGSTRALPGPGPWHVFVGNTEGVRLSVGSRSVAVPNARHGSGTARFLVGADGAVQ